MKRSLQPNFGNQLRLNFQMTAATDTIIEMHDNGTVVLSRQLFVDRQQVRIQSYDRLVSFFSFDKNFLVQEFRSLFHGMPLFFQDITCCPHPLFLQPFRLAFLLRLLHQLQQLILHACHLLLASINFCKHGAVFLIGLHCAKLTLDLVESVLGTLQFHLQVVLLAFIAVDFGLHRFQLLACLIMGTLGCLELPWKRLLLPA